jgi:hypothetical protein
MRFGFFGSLSGEVLGTLAACSQKGNPGSFPIGRELFTGDQAGSTPRLWPNDELYWPVRAS